MFNVGPLELMVLIVVGLVVLGPDKLPGLARDAARMLKTLREMATGARTQLRDELGPEFADLGLDEFRRLNPRTALQRAILGDEDLRDLDPRRAMRDVARDYRSDDEPVSMQKPTASAPPEPARGPAQRPLGRNEQAPFDSDAT